MKRAIVFLILLVLASFVCYGEYSIVGSYVDRNFFQWNIYIENGELKAELYCTTFLSDEIFEVTYEFINNECYLKLRSKRFEIAGLIWLDSEGLYFEQGRGKGKVMVDIDRKKEFRKVDSPLNKETSEIMSYVSIFESGTHYKDDEKCLVTIRNESSRIIIRKYFLSETLKVISIKEGIVSYIDGTLLAVFEDEVLDYTTILESSVKTNYYFGETPPIFELDDCIYSYLYYEKGSSSSNKSEKALVEMSKYKSSLLVIGVFGSMILNDMKWISNIPGAGSSDSIEFDPFEPNFTKRTIGVIRKHYILSWDNEIEGDSYSIRIEYEKAE